MGGARAGGNNWNLHCTIYPSKYKDKYYVPANFPVIKLIIKKQLSKKLQATKFSANVYFS